MDFDKRLVDLFNEYDRKGQKKEFVSMTKSYLDAITAAERRAARNLLEEKKRIAKEMKDAMTAEQKIEFLNTPYEKLPDELKAGMTENPQVLNFIRMSHPHIGEQKDTFAARYVRMKEKYQLTDKEVSDMANIFAKKFDLKKTDKHKAQKTRVTVNDLQRYENYNITPKIDKLTAISRALGFSIAYCGGYGPESMCSKNDVLEAKYRKRRNSNPLENIG